MVPAALLVVKRHISRSARIQTRTTTVLQYPPQHRWMTTAYSGQPGDGKAGLSKLEAWIPLNTTLSDETRVQIGPFEESEWPAGMALMNHIIREDDPGRYFLSHDAFAVRSLETKQLLGCFYVKPNFPGRCSHICNGGFITHPDFRRRGVARLMGKVFLKAARELGYKSAYFNLVFQSNEASVALWESLGFQRVAVLENAARLKEWIGSIRRLVTDMIWNVSMKPFP